MKKVLSAILAAAMVMGMSVSAFAAEYSVPASVGTVDAPINLGSEVVWGNAHHFQGKKEVKVAPVDSQVDFALEAGDVIYFEVKYDDPNDGADAYVLREMPNDWIVKINNAEYVEDAELVVTKDINGLNNALHVKVTIADDFDAKDVTRENEDEQVEFFMYIKDANTKKESAKAKVHFSLAEYEVIYLCESDVKDVVEVEEDVLYALCDGKNNKKCTEKCDHKSAMVVLDFDGVMVKAKFFKGDEILVKSSEAFKWNKSLSKKYDTDIEVLTFNTELDVREVIFESAKDNKQVVAVVDGDLVAVESEFVSKYEIIKGVELVKGYVADVDANAGAYALVDADLEIEAEEVEVEAEKANPETGAADFVGAAVAMAVVSVAAAGALALKK